MPIPSTHMHTCPNCGSPIEESRYVMRADGTYRCEHCYFNDTYLEGVVHRMDTAYLVTLEALVSAIDAREHEVGNHSLRVTEFSLIIGKTAGVTGRNLVDLYCGALLHDIGKIGVPDAVLHKRGPLLPEEQAAMHRHPEIGFRIIGHIGYFARAAQIVRSHHEHFDGTGYPRGLAGEDIPHGARIFAVADALDALTVRRPYREPVSFDEALELVMKESGTIYDPDIVGVLLRAADELREYVGRIVLDSMDPRKERRVP
jgi:HD-GYP domain-containing protein (c-di-GMP phosphodiesterase class II)